MVERYPRKFQSGDDLFAWYKSHRWYHGRLARLIAQFLEWQVEDFFRHDTLPVPVNITHREKSLRSLRSNIKRSKRRYKFPLPREWVPDLAGVRVIFYFRDDAARFCDDAPNLFGRWFGRYCSENSRDLDGHSPKGKRGRNRDYDSIHFPVRVERDTEFYRALNEMDQAYLEGLYCEVQVRTILMHGYAECNHEIRYKAPRAIKSERNKIFEEKFHYIYEQLRGADRALNELKGEFLLDAPPSSEPPRPKYWRFERPSFPGAAKIGGVEYAYELLDRGRASEPDAPFTVTAVTTVFNVDAVIEKITGVKRYKQLMWNALRREEPQFVVAITYDSTVVRATSWDSATRTLGVEFAAYSDQVVTNHEKAHDKRIPNDPRGRAVRDLAIDSSGSFLSFSESPLSNTVGVSCVIRTSDDAWVVGFRSSSVAFDPDRWGCSTSGALAWVELGHWEKRDFDGWFKNGIVREVEEELGYTPEPDEVHYLGLAREFGRLGKPQVFFFIDASIRYDYLVSKFRTYKQLDSEYQALRPLTLAQVQDLISDDDKRVNDATVGEDVGEELRFNLALALRFLGEVE